MYHEIPTDTEVYRTYYKWIAQNFDYLTVHREFGTGSTPEKIVERISREKQGSASGNCQGTLSDAR